MKKIIDWFKSKWEERKRKKRFKKKIEELKKRDPFLLQVIWPINLVWDHSFDNPRPRYYNRVAIHKFLNF
jgi:hypothetical protein